MPYTLEDYARDLQSKTESELWGLLTVAKCYVHRYRELQEISYDLEKTASTKTSCENSIPVLLAEAERRGLKVPRWVEPGYFDQDYKPDQEAPKPPRGT